MLKLETIDLRRWAFLMLICPCVSFSRPATALDFIVRPAQGNAPAIVIVMGEFMPGDEDEFVRRVVSLREALVVFSSPGGNLAAGLEIGKAIRLKNFSTFVPEDTFCSSACALAWLGGTERIMATSAKIGFHAAYRTGGGFAQESGMANALVGAYLNSLGLPNRAVAYMTVASPDSMMWLTAADAGALGLNVSIYNPTGVSIQHKTSPSPAGPKQNLEVAQATEKTKAVQNCLKGFKFYLGPLNGILDEETSYAIGNFQSAWEMRVTGGITYELLAKCGLPVE